ncbi:hypothetical protein JTB14_019341 [Gonioctena quinquepunctata]|nr:hypothetical protein JTB14_019341 [Gonioctena quinquepunctata]
MEHSRKRSIAWTFARGSGYDISENDNTTINNINTDGIKFQLRDRSHLISTSKYCDYFMAMPMVAEDCVPREMEEALNSGMSSQWKNGMDEEVNSLLQIETWKLSHLPENRQAIDNRWI